MPLQKGLFLIAEPFMGDPNFERSVVLLCEHNTEGSFGFVVNQSLDLSLHSLFDTKLSEELTIFKGGPVGLEELFYIHNRPDLIQNATALFDGLYIGGDFESVIDLLMLNLLQPTEIKFFKGYSGWGVGQLESEMKRNSWILHKATENLVLNTNPKELWREVLKQKGGDYKVMANYPIDPRLN